MTFQTAFLTLFYLSNNYKIAQIVECKRVNFRHIPCKRFRRSILMPTVTSDNITNLLQKYLDVQSRRSEVIAGNIANADTPGYAAKTLEFDEYLRRAANSSDQNNSMNLDSGDLRVVEQKSEAVGLDGNTVDTGREMAELAQVGSSFNFGAKMLQSRLRLLRTAIREGR